MLIAGIDPGLDGGLALYNPEDGSVEVVRMPTLIVTKARRRVDAHALAALFWKWHCGHAFLEMAWSRPENGAISAQKSGVGYGVIIGVLAAVGVPMTEVSPQKWKKALHVPAAKDGARARASQLLPQAADQWPLKGDDGKAEACLIAVYGARQFPPPAFSTTPLFAERRAQ